LKLDLPVRTGVARQRLDPGAEKGDYLLRRLEVLGW